MTTFSNVPIDFDSIPQADNIEFIPISKKYLIVRVLSDIILFSVFFIGLFLIKFLNDNPPEIIKYYFIYLTLGVGTFALLVITINILGIKWKGFVIREKDIIYRTGLIFRRKIHVPFNRVQHCEVNQGVIDRYMDLAKLKIYTAGGSKSDLTIPGLKNEDALKMKSFILQKTGEDESA